MSALALAELAERAGIPKGVLNIVTADDPAPVGAEMTSNPLVRMVTFTGSSKAGTRVGELCGKHLKKVQLELGGKNALVLLDDADLDIAASNAAWGTFLHQGQICMSTGLILAQEGIVEGLTERLVGKATHLPVGDPSAGQVALGPIVDDNQVAKIQAIVDDAVAKGAKLLAGGKAEGRFYKPTVLAGIKPGMLAFEEEIFGPVACIVAFKDDAEAVELANKSDYGLAAGVISANFGRAMALGEQLNVGQLHINDQTVNGGPFAPFGGRGRSGNGTRIGGPADIEEFTQWQWISTKEQATPYPF